MLVTREVSSCQNSSLHKNVEVAVLFAYQSDHEVDAKPERS